MDISANPDLIWLVASHAQLTELDVTHNPALEYLDLRWNPLEPGFKDWLGEMEWGVGEVLY